MHETDTTERVCRRCGYSLAGHAGRRVRCPECGRWNTPADHAAERAEDEAMNRLLGPTAACGGGIILGLLGPVLLRISSGYLVLLPLGAALFCLGWFSKTVRRFPPSDRIVFAGSVLYFSGALCAFFVASFVALQLLNACAGGAGWRVLGSPTAMVTMLMLGLLSLPSFVWCLVRWSRCSERLLLARTDESDD